MISCLFNAVSERFVIRRKNGYGDRHKIGVMADLSIYRKRFFIYFIAESETFLNE